MGPFAAPAQLAAAASFRAAATAAGLHLTARLAASRPGRCRRTPHLTLHKRPLLLAGGTTPLRGLALMKSKLYAGALSQHALASAAIASRRRKELSEMVIPAPASLAKSTRCACFLAAPVPAP